jgi:hypothetical protein
VTLPGEGKIEQTIQFSNNSAGTKFGVVRISDRFIQSDDAFYFSYAVASQCRILHVQGAQSTNQALAAVFEGDPYFSYQRISENTVDFGTLGQQNLLILDEVSRIGTGLQQELVKYAQAGGSILIIPGLNIELGEYNALLQTLQVGQLGELNDQRGNAQKVATLSLEHPIYKGIFDERKESWELPRVEQYRTIILPQQSNQQKLMTLQNGDPFLTAGHFGAGRVYIAASSLDRASSNFITHGLFSTTMLRISEFAQHQQPLYYTLGSDERVVLKNIQTGTDGTFKLRHLETKAEYIPEHRNAGSDSELLIRTEPKVAGNYEVLLGDSVVTGVSFNLNRQESDTRSYTVNEVAEKLQEKGVQNWLVLDLDGEHLAAQADTLADGEIYWMRMIILALIFLAIEILLIKFWK